MALHANSPRSIQLYTSYYQIANYKSLDGGALQGVITQTTDLPTSGYPSPWDNAGTVLSELTKFIRCKQAVVYRILRADFIFICELETAQAHPHWYLAT